ncbi:MAG: alpha-E domain-containing protein [Bacteroidota bacterium]
MLSRVADTLFWLGRYLERAENYARFIDVNFNLCIDLPPGMKEQWDPLISATGDRELFISLYGSNFSRQNAILFLAFDEQNPNAIISTIAQSRENARMVRESIPKECWESLNDLHHYVRNAKKRKVWQKEDPHAFFEYVKNGIHTFNGIAGSTAPRTQAWYFTQIGKQLERADKTSRILDVKYHYLLPSVDEVGSPLDFLQWTALLKSVSAFNAYKHLYQKIQPDFIVQYLVLSRYFPRSIFYCITEVENALQEISGSKRHSNSAEKAIGALRSKLEYTNVNDILKYGLHEFLDEVQVGLNEISSSIYDQYFKVMPNYSVQEQTQH